MKNCDWIVFSDSQIEQKLTLILHTHSPVLVAYMIYFNGVGSTPDLTSSICWGFPERYAMSSGVEDDDGRPFVANRCALLWHCQGAKYKVFNDCYQDLWGKFHTDSRNSHNCNEKWWSFLFLESSWWESSLILSKAIGKSVVPKNTQQFFSVFSYKLKCNTYIVFGYKKNYQSLSFSDIFFLEWAGYPRNKSVSAWFDFFSFWECLHLKAWREDGCAAV